MKFVGRSYEEQMLEERLRRKEASLIVLYGRRRVGKTRLVEEFYKDVEMWKFEGLEKQPKERQIKSFLLSLSRFSKNPLYETAHCNDWIEAFKLLDQAIINNKLRGKFVIFFDELPYMANRRNEMISDLTWAWNNLWSKRENFTLVLCGSIASFMVNSVIRSSALYGRIQLEICLKPLSLKESYDFFEGKKSQEEIVNLYMFCGGIPAYLQLFNNSSSTAVNINRLAFTKDGYFVNEFNRIFKDAFHEDRIYKKIVMLFSKYKSLKSTELLALLEMTEGSGFNRYLDNLEKAGFIKGFAPCGKPLDSKLRRYKLDDEFLHFFFKFIEPNIIEISANSRRDLFSKIMLSRKYQSWAGFAFERMCLKHADQIAESLKIDQLVKSHGAYYDRSTNEKEGVQIDLIFERHDPVITICEIKYHTEKIGKWIIDEMEEKISKLQPAKASIEKVLLTSQGITKDLEASGYFSRVLLPNCLFIE